MIRLKPRSWGPNEMNMHRFVSENECRRVRMPRAINMHRHRRNKKSLSWESIQEVSMPTNDKYA